MHNCSVIISPYIEVPKYSTRNHTDHRWKISIISESKLCFSSLLSLPFLFLQLVDVTWLKEDFLWDRETTSVLWTTRDSMAHGASVVMNSLREKWSRHWAKPITQTVLCVLSAGMFSTCSCVSFKNYILKDQCQAFKLTAYRWKKKIVLFSIIHFLKSNRILKKCKFIVPLFFPNASSVLCYLMCEVFKVPEKLPVSLLSGLLPQMLLYFPGVC